jgi:hypothetical protein
MPNLAAMQVPPFSLNEQLNALGEELDQAVLQVLRSGQYIGGSVISGFEQAFAAGDGRVPMPWAATAVPMPWCSPCALSVSAPAMR